MQAHEERQVRTASRRYNGLFLYWWQIAVLLMVIYMV